MVYTAQISIKIRVLGSEIKQLGCIIMVHNYYCADCGILSIVLPGGTVFCWMLRVQVSALYDPEKDATGPKRPVI